MVEKARIYEKLRLGDDEDVSASIKDNLLVDFDRHFHEHRDQYEFDKEEEMVEYVDEFGRTRRAPESKELNSFLGEIRSQMTSNAPPNESSNTHFDDTAEVRTKGVGYYRFSRAEGERQRQIQELDGLRQETVDARTRNMIVKQRREQMKQERLRRIQERRNAS